MFDSRVRQQDGVKARTFATTPKTVRLWRALTGSLKEWSKPAAFPETTGYPA